MTHKECAYGDGPSYSRGFCKRHYNQWYRTGGFTSAEVLPHGRLSAGSEAAIWARIEKRGEDECWPWKGYIGRAGYGAVKWKGRMSRAHRVVYTLTSGAIPDEVLIRHTCDNPPCCNPSHLLAGTPQDNMSDKMARDRWRGNAVTVGEKHVRAKLTESAVRAIRAEYAAGATCTTLGTKYGVNPSTVMQVVNRLTWKHLDPPTPEDAI